MKNEWKMWRVQKAMWKSTVNQREAKISLGLLLVPLGHYDLSLFFFFFFFVVVLHVRIMY
jgi:hypothetical protein